MELSLSGPCSTAVSCRRCPPLTTAVFSGAYISLLAPATFRFAKNVEEIGVRMGVAFLSFAIASLIGSPIAGYILGSSLRWTPVAVFSGVWIFAGGVLILVSRTLRARDTGTQLV